MHKAQEQVEEFMRMAGQKVMSEPITDWMPLEDRILREHLITSEYLELVEALAQRDPVKIAHEATDLLYVTYAIFATLGIDAEPLFDAIHQANMLKAGGPKDKYGKLLKPVGWKSAEERVSELIKDQGETDEGATD